jgi:hypothetical protein
MPGTSTSTSKVSSGTYAEWASDPHSCGSSAPIREALPLEIAVASPEAKVATLQVSTQADGSYVDTKGLLPLAREIAPWCAGSKVLVSDATPPMPPPADSPQAPQGAKRRHGTPLVPAPPAVPAIRPTLADLTRRNPESGALARQCCVAETTKDNVDACIDRCIRAGDAGQCANGKRACDALAVGEFSDESGDRCDELLKTCLHEHGSSMSKVAACRVTCTTDKVTEACK